MATQLLYLNDFDVVTCTGKVQSVEATEDGRSDVVLDQTCFYPRGGGQDWDEGTITGSNGAVFAVQEVRLDESGVAHHHGAFTAGSFKPGDDVACAADAERRSVNTRLHSAGHLVDLAVDRLGYPWTPGRGAHYPTMSFVEYSGEWNAEQAETIRNDIERTIAEVIASDAAKQDNDIRFMPKAEMHTVCRFVPENIPANKPARVVVYCGDFGVPCGGTHVRNLSQVGIVHITKVKKKDGAVRVSYTIEGVN